MELEHGPEIYSKAKAAQTIEEMVKAVLEDIANEVEYQLTPFAFRCNCRGRETSCRAAMDDPATYAQWLTAQRAAAIIRKGLDK